MSATTPTRSLTSTLKKWIRPSRRRRQNRRRSQFETLDRRTLFAADLLSIAAEEPVTISEDASLISESSTVPVDASYSESAEGPSNKWQNLSHNIDVNGDGHFSENDISIVVDEINRMGARKLPADFVGPVQYIDVNGDHFVSSADALFLVNEKHANGFRPLNVSDATESNAVEEGDSDLPEGEQASSGGSSREEFGIKQKTTVEVAAAYLPKPVWTTDTSPDVNRDGSVNSKDVLSVMNYLKTGKTEFPVEQLDANLNGQVNFDDITTIMLRMRGERESPNYDVNRDGRVSSLDAHSVVSFVNLGASHYPFAQLDVNRDRDVNIEDATAIMAQIRAASCTTASVVTH